jgi:hypothetical protein
LVGSDAQHLVFFKDNYDLIPNQGIDLLFRSCIELLYP